VKVIAILRDPIDRAVSHYNHSVALGFETLKFAEALQREAGRLAGEEARIYREPTYRSFSHQHHSYLSRSKYVEQLARWLDCFNRRQVLILRAEDLLRDPVSVVAESQSFLEVEVIRPHNAKVRNARSYEQIDDSVRARLKAEFAPYNKRLYALIDRDLGWGY
jgi:predicted metal-dependent hydrolase